MIMLDGVLYRDTYDMVDADSVDESKAAYAESYTDGVPANDGEVNFDMNPSRNSAYIVCDDGSLVVKVEGNWYRFEGRIAQTNQKLKNTEITIKNNNPFVYRI